jgi:hypothetical protein
VQLAEGITIDDFVLHSLTPMKKYIQVECSSLTATNAWCQSVV